MFETYQRRINDAELKREHNLSLEKGQMTDELGVLLYSLAMKNVMKKYPNFKQHKEDLAMYCFERALTYWQNYDPQRGSHMGFYLTIMATQTTQAVQSLMRSRRAKRAAERAQGFHSWEDQAYFETDNQLRDQGLRQGPRGYIVPLDETDEESAERLGFILTKDEMVALDFQRGKIRKNGGGRKSVMPTKAQLIEDIQSGLKTGKDIGDKYGVIPATVHTWLSRYGISLAKRQEIYEKAQAKSATE